MHLLRKLSPVASLVVVAAVSWTLSACGLQSTAPGASVTHAQKAAVRRESVSITPVTEKVCIDATISSDPGFAEGVRNDVVDSLAAWAPALPSKPPISAVAETPGLNLFVRQVTTDSYATNQPALDLQIPGTPALQAPPNIDDPNLATDQVAWAEQEQRWASAVKAARAAEAGEVAALRGYRLKDTVGNWSAISGCIAALADEGVQNASVRMVVASDLEENRPPVSADYAGASFLIDQSCPPNGEASCTALAKRWTARLHRQGAGAMTVIRADAATQAISSWLLGARS